MTLTEPTKGTRKFLALRDKRCDQLRAFLKQSGCTTPSRKREAMRRAAEGRNG
jgi:hypothetical protein